MTTKKNPERFKDKLAIVGFASTTREQAPFDDPDYEIWTVNEAGNIRIDAFKWVKRFDRLFQIHPRWDFTRENNGNDPNHWLWLQAKSGTCNMCKGTGLVDGKECQMCDKGVYNPPESRSWPRVIYNQKQYDDIPGSVKYPLDEMIALNPAGRYFDSTLSYMLMLASTMGYSEIFVVGFEMSAQSEYFYQRANAEYLIGILQERGINIVLPADSSICKTSKGLYGYENMKTGYRQQLDMRLAVLNNELAVHQTGLATLEGEVKTWKTAMELSKEPALQTGFEDASKRYGKKLGLVNLVNGALLETENLRKLYDRYFVAEGVEGETTVRKDTDEFIKTIYETQ